jgi:hypothetical protein
MADKAYNVESFKGTITIPTSNTVTTGTQVIGAVNGVTKTIFFTTDDMQDTDSTAMTITNSSDAVFFNSGTKAESTTSIIGSEVGIVPGDKIVMTAEGTQSAARSIVFDIRYLT